MPLTAGGSVPLTSGGLPNIQWTKFERFYERKDPTFSIRIEVLDVEKWNRFLELTPTFLEKYYMLFRDVVHQSHKYLIRVTPFDTGRLRAGWTGVLEKYQIDYAMAFIDTSLIETKSTVPSPSAIAEGKGLSSMIDKPFDVTITNNVFYSQYVEFGTSKMQGRHFTQRAMYKSEYIMAQAMDDWLREISTTGDIVSPKAVAEVTG